MVIVKLISGLGNQLFQYVVGRQLSIKRNVPLKLDVSFFDNQNLRKYRLSHYNINAGLATAPEVSEFLKMYNSTSLYARLYRKAEKTLPKRIRPYFKESQWWVYEPELLKVSLSNVYLDGYWQHYKYFQDIDPLIFEELMVKETYTGEAKVMESSVFQQPSSVSLHIRRGDYITDPDAYRLMGVLPAAYYHKAVQYIRQKVKDPVFYIFSDDLDWAKANLTVSGPVVFVDLAGGARDYVELDIMRKCRHNIIANSSFSWWGAFLNRNPDKIVIAPANWVLPPDINKRIELQFPSWIKM